MKLIDVVRGWCDCIITGKDGLHDGGVEELAIRAPRHLTTDHRTARTEVRHANEVAVGRRDLVEVRGVAVALHQQAGHHARKNVQLRL